MFSVVVPVYNHERYLEQAVASALRSHLVSEVLLLDDGSRDGSAALAKRLAATHPRVHDLTPAGGGNRGAHNRLNELVHAARCEWIAVLNSDDFFVTGRFEIIASHPQFETSDFVFGYLLFINGASVLTGAKRGALDPGVPFPKSMCVARLISEGKLLDLLAHQNYIGTTSNMVFRKSLHEVIGGFAPYRYVHDWDFALRAMIQGRALHIPRFLTAYRMHTANTISEDSRKVNAEAEDLFRRLLSDFPQVLRRPEFSRALDHNANGVCLSALLPSLTEAALVTAV